MPGKQEDHVNIEFLEKNNISYCFPEMLVHYITKHGYKPPQEFLDAVTELKIEEPPKVEHRGALTSDE